MIKLKPYSASMLALGGILIAAMGIYFIFVRPPLLPEDLRYMKAILLVMHDSASDLSVWLQIFFG